MSECERHGCGCEATYIAAPYGTDEQLCPYHAYFAANRRHIYPKDV